MAPWVARPASVQMNSNPPIHRTYVLVLGVVESVDEIESSVLAIARCSLISRLPPAQIKQKISMAAAV